MYWTAVILILVCSCLKVIQDRESSVIHSEVGRDIAMKCSYELEDDTLYSIKWYKGDKEFYRFLPRGEQSKYYCTYHLSFFQSLLQSPHTFFPECLSTEDHPPPTLSSRISAAPPVASLSVKCLRVLQGRISNTTGHSVSGMFISGSPNPC